MSRYNLKPCYGDNTEFAQSSYKHQQQGYFELEHHKKKASDVGYVKEGGI